MIQCPSRHVRVCDFLKHHNIQILITHYLKGDLLQAVISAPKVLPAILPAFIPYTLVLAGFGAFVVWNEGIVLGRLKQPRSWGICTNYSLLGDKSNHIPSFHIPQLYYFVAAATFFGWPALISGAGGVSTLGRNVWSRMFGSNRYVRSVVMYLGSNVPHTKTNPCNDR